MEVTVLKDEVVVWVTTLMLGVETGAVNILRVVEKGVSIPIPVTAGNPIFTLGVVPLGDEAHNPTPIKEVAVGVTMESAAGAPKLIAPTVTGILATAAAVLAVVVETGAMSVLVVAVTVASEEMSWVSAGRPLQTIKQSSNNSNEHHFLTSCV